MGNLPPFNPKIHSLGTHTKEFCRFLNGHWAFSVRRLKYSWFPNSCFVHRVPCQVIWSQNVGRVRLRTCVRQCGTRAKYRRPRSAPTRLGWSDPFGHGTGPKSGVAPAQSGVLPVSKSNVAQGATSTLPTTSRQHGADANPDAPPEVCRSRTRQALD
jgi:hypothetical protein